MPGTGPPTRFARIAGFHFEDEGAGLDSNAHLGSAEVIYPSTTHGGMKGDAVPDHGGVPFRAHAAVYFRDEDETKWTNIHFSAFRKWYIEDDPDGDYGGDKAESYIKPCHFEHELLNPGLPHLKWHPCNAPVEAKTVQLESYVVRNF